MKLKYIGFICILTTALSAWAKIETVFEPNPSAFGVPVQLVLSSDKPFDGAPNLSVLEKDFIGSKTSGKTTCSTL